MTSAIGRMTSGASDWPTFAEKAQKLISTDHVAATFHAVHYDKLMGVKTPKAEKNS